MSHFATIKTQIRDLTALGRALGSMGLELQITTHGKLKARGYQGKMHDVDAVARLGNCDVGFNRAEDGTYEIVADRWMMRRDPAVGTTDVDGWFQRLTQTYSAEVIKPKALQEGWSQFATRTEQDGTVVLEYVR